MNKCLILEGENLIAIKAVLTAMALTMALPVAATTVHFGFGGTVTGSEYGAAAAADIYAVAPVGSAFSFDFAYNPATPPTFGGPKGASYANVPVAAKFVLGGTSFALPTLNIATGGGPFDGSVRFTVFGNAPFSNSRLAGYQLADFSLLLSDPTGTALPTGALPTSFDLTRFAVRTVRPRFVFGRNGETALTLSVALPAAVPEPATWTSLIVGFGLTGAVARRHRVSTRALYEA